MIQIAIAFRLTARPKSHENKLPPGKCSPPLRGKVNADVTECSNQSYKMSKSVLQNVQIFAKIAKISVFATLSVSSADVSLPVKPLSNSQKIAGYFLRVTNFVPENKKRRRCRKYGKKPLCFWA